ncbi:hypothetical protein M758_UG091600 [Ceratodon purpureus]|nr:hypothetical protein M758_UG091600 [Ceratodon purpureus]
MLVHNNNATFNLLFMEFSRLVHCLPSVVSCCRTFPPRSGAPLGQRSLMEACSHCLDVSVNTSSKAPSTSLQNKHFATSAWDGRISSQRTTSRSGM